MFVSHRNTCVSDRKNVWWSGNHYCLFAKFQRLSGRVFDGWLHMSGIAFLIIRFLYPVDSFFILSPLCIWQGIVLQNSNSLEPVSITFGQSSDGESDAIKTTLMAESPAPEYYRWTISAVPPRSWQPNFCRWGSSVISIDQFQEQVPSRYHSRAPYIPLVWWSNK